MKIGRFRRNTNPTPFKYVGPGVEKKNLPSLGAAVAAAQGWAIRQTGEVSVGVYEYDDILYMVVRDRDGVVHTMSK